MSFNLEQQAKLAFDCAKSSELQAKKTQELAQILKQQGENAASSGELIHQYAVAAIHHAQAAQSHALAAQRNARDSMQEYILALVEHQQEISLHLKVSKEYMKFVKNRNSLWQEFSQDTSK